MKTILVIFLAIFAFAEDFANQEERRAWYDELPEEVKVEMRKYRRSWRWRNPKAWAESIAK